jgi:PKD repeat protein
MQTKLLSILFALLSYSALGQITHPNEISGLQLWLKSDTGVVLDANQKVLEWQDQSGQERHAQNTNPARRPSYPQQIIGPYPSVFFDGVDDFLNFSEITTVRTVFWILKEDQSATFNSRALLGHNTAFHFHRGTEGRFWAANFASPFVVNGTTRMNQLQIIGSNVIVPDDFIILSLVTTGNVSASNFAADREILARAWKGDLLELIIYDVPLTNNEVVSVENYLRNRYAPPVNLGEDIILEYALCAEIEPDWNYENYTWNSGSQSSSITANKSGVYSVTTTDIFGFESSDSIEFLNPFQTINNSSICLNADLVWDSGLDNGYSFLWNTGDTTNAITINEGGLYFVSVQDTLQCSFSSDTVQIDIDNYELTLQLGPTDSLCAGNSIFLVEGALQTTEYLWSDGSTQEQLTIFESGDYWVETININGCIGVDTITVFVQCNAPQVQYQLNQFCEQLPVLFQDQSIIEDGSQIIATQWTINGIAFDQSTFEYTFEEFGIYNLALFVQTDAGCSSLLSETIEIYARPQVNFIHSIACSGQSTLFEDDSEMLQGSIAEYYWDFGNVETSNSPFAFVQFNTTGIQQVSLTLTSSNGCDSTLVKEVYVNSTPAATFTWQPTCIGTAMSFTNDVDVQLNPLVEHTWNFGSGLNSNLPNPSFNYLFSGNHVVTHYVHAIIDGFAVCFNQHEEVVFVSPPPVVSFSQTAACLGDVTFFENTTMAGQGDEVLSQLWFINGVEQSDATQFEWIPSVTGAVLVNLQVFTQGGCNANVTQSVLVGNQPIPEFTFTPEIGMPPLLVHFYNLGSYGSFWMWNFGNLAESFEQEPTYTFLDTGIYEISLIIVDEAGCFGESVQEIQVMQPIFDASIEQVSCTQNQNGLGVSCIIGNYGNHALRSADITVWLANGTQVTEHWEGTLARNNLMEFTFQSILSFDDQINNSYVCVEIGNLNGGGEDSNPSNNKLCKSFSTSGFELFSIFPNPAIEIATLNFYVKTRSEVQFRIFQSDGKMVYESAREYLPGFNQIQFNTRKYSSGLYLIEATSREDREIQRILINNHIKQ